MNRQSLQLNIIVPWSSAFRRDPQRREGGKSFQLYLERWRNSPTDVEEALCFLSARPSPAELSGEPKRNDKAIISSGKSFFLFKKKYIQEI